MTVAIFIFACMLPHVLAIILERANLLQELEYARADVLGLAATWPQAACSLPGPGSAFDWEGDRPLNIPMEDLIIYEMHVRGFTWDASSGVRSPGGPSKPRHEAT